MKKLFFSLLLALPALNLSADLEGEYRVKGVDPSTHEHYKGTAYIYENGDVYNIYWKFDDGSQSAGTGLLTGDRFSVVYEDLPNTSGVISYRVKQRECKKHCAYSLKGPWVDLGGNQVGYEELCQVREFD